MRVRILELLALGTDLRDGAERDCDCINASHLLVHEVLSEAFVDNPALLEGGALRGEMLSRLRHKLIAGSIGHRVSL